MKEMGMGRGVGEGENSPCCLHALGLGPVPHVLLKKAIIPAHVPITASGTGRLHLAHVKSGGCNKPVRAGAQPRPRHWGYQRPPQMRLQEALAPPRSPVPSPQHGNGPTGRRTAGAMQSPPGTRWRRRRGARSWGAAIAGAHCTGRERGLPGLGSHHPERHTITGPLSRGKEASVFILWREKAAFFTADRAPVTGSPLTPELCWKDKHSSFPEHNKVPP